MGPLFLSLLTVALVLVCGFLILLVLMQRTSNTGGMGAALGGGASEQVFGAETTNVLTKGTIYSTIAFFVLALVLYLLYQSSLEQALTGTDARDLAGAADPAVLPAAAATSGEFLPAADATATASGESEVIVFPEIPLEAEGGESELPATPAADATGASQ